MEWLINNRRKLLVLSIVGIVLLIGGYITYDKLVFRLKSTSPDTSQVATVSVFIKLNFSQPIKSVGKIELDSNPVDFTIDGSSVKVILPDLIEDKLYKLTFSDINSNWFNKKIPNKSISFTPIYKDYESLSDEQKNALISESSSGQINDPFLNNGFPILTDGFKLDVSNLGDGKSIVVNVTFLKEIPDYDNGGRITQLSKSEADKLRDEVYKKIKSLNGSPDKYLIYYSNNYLNAKYNKSLD